MDNKANIKRITRDDRRCNGVTSHKILEIKGNKLVLDAGKKFCHGKIEFAVSDVSKYKVGDRLDFIVSYVANSGKVSSYQATFLGETPKEFCD